MMEPSENDGQSVLNAYRIEQLEEELARLKKTREKLSPDQIKQMLSWLGIPVVVATGVFGVALWQSIELSTISAAEARATQTVDSLTADIERLEDRITLLQERSEQTFTQMVAIRARADESARSAQRQADAAEARALEASRSLSDLQRTAATAADIQRALADVDQIASTVAQNAEFQTTVAQLALDNVAGMVAAFDQSEGCPDGWTEFVEAAGRTIIGVGQGEIDGIGDQDIPLTLRRWRDFGGTETHLLKIDEMPAHDHGGIFGTDGSRPRGTNDHRPETAHSTVRISSEGGNQPHNNMPPYVALFYCEKDPA